MLFSRMQVYVFGFVLLLTASDAMGETRYFRTLEAVLLKDENHRITDILPKGSYLMLESNTTGPATVQKILEKKEWQLRTGTIGEEGIDVTDVVNRARNNERARFILITKSRFLLEVFEFDNKIEFKVFEAEVGLGMDGCLPQDEGGRCYYTQPGTYNIRWKVYDPEGIEWCIPDYMTEEKRYAKDMEAGQRCFRGSLGKYALNIGSSYAIHGTTDPASLGEKSTHGCIRIAIEPMKSLFFFMNEGDPVYIVP